MKLTSWCLRGGLVTVLVGAATVALPQAQGRGAAPAQTTSTDAVPSDLRPLLSPRRSEMRLVTQRYTLDRATLDGNYAGGFGGRGGRVDGGGPVGAAPAATPPAPVAPPVSMSLARLDRLARFDRAWAEALGRLDATALSPEARSELTTLRANVAANTERLVDERRTVAEMTTLVPFAPSLVRLVEARLWIEPMDAKAAAGTLSRATEAISAVRAILQAGLANAPSSLTASRDQALRAAAVVDSLHRDMTEWFNFYNGYDPMFTWWMGLPWQHADAALRQYATFLRETIAPADRAAAAPTTLTATEMVQNPRAAAPGADVPDLNALIALPQDEMTAIVDLFRSATSGRGRGPAPPSRGAAYYRQWLQALQSLDFDRLSRNAQVDYLFIRRVSERQIERDGVPLPAPASNPRKTDSSGIPGPARGREGLIRDLQDEFIPYTPEELIQLAEKEFAWADAEMLKASREMGFGDNWKAAMDKVKDSHAPPGGQPVVIRDLMHEAVDYLRAKDLITVPAVAAESFLMSMMSPERQLVNPFFTGGARITVSYPTNTMTYDQRLQSMRGNTTAFSHATAHHEMIPGHNLTSYLGARYNGYRANLGAGTPFFGEGWALYWELVLYDKGFNDTPEERIGALFWRMHRCARIIFSLNFHMGRWSPQEAIDFLVTRVNFERENAIAEVRRSFDPSAGYSALYQAAYLLGGLQLRGLRRELVDSGRMTEREFHDRIVIQGSMPIALHRLAVTPERLRRDMTVEWRFYD
jgi:uncharacterized protein (DUF885 family)